MSGAPYLPVRTAVDVRGAEALRERVVAGVGEVAAGQRFAGRRVGV